MAAYRYRPLPRYRYRGKSTGRDRAIGLTAAAVIAIAATSKIPAVSRSQHSAPPSAAAVPVTSGSEKAFIRATLADLAAPATTADITSLAAWYLHEYPSWPPGAANNPWNSTLTAPGSTNFNTFGDGLHVQDYPTATEGAQETAQNIVGGYPLITRALRSGSGLCGDPSLAAEFLTWSGNSYSGVC